jgi:hypothetical protein
MTRRVRLLPRSVAGTAFAATAAALVAASAAVLLLADEKRSGPVGGVVAGPGHRGAGRGE